MTGPIPAQLHTDISLFYARHMRAMDEGRVADWTSDFAEDAIFITNARPDHQIGRSQIAEGAHAAAQALNDAGDRRRHCLTNLEVHSANPESTDIRAHTYALIVRTPPNGPSATEFLCTCTDELTTIDGRWLITRRRVERDDLRGE